MSISDQERQNEQQRVNQVVKEIDQRMERLGENASTLKGDVVDIRKHFWSGVTVNVDNADEAAETYVSIKQQAELLSERERSYRQANQQLQALEKLKWSPYFGRIDFTEDGEENTEVIYIGTSSLLDVHDEQFLVYDWRAPISSLYYDYSPGRAAYDTPEGSISGEMELKRQYIIRKGCIRSLFDTGVTIGDELLQEVLGKQANNQMKSIVGTIQKEQNEIIRNERSRLLIVQGAAGSGKTSAALQRVAYLLYRYRGTLKAENVVLFSPNPMFNSYVSTVLPELGEENMQQTTFQAYLEHRLGQTFHLEDPFTQMEYVLTAMSDPGYKARIEGIRFKAGIKYMEVMDSYAEFLGHEALIFKDIVFRKKVLVSGEKIKERFYGLDASLSIPNRLAMVTEWLLGELKIREKAERDEPWVEDEAQLMSKEDYLRAYKQLTRKRRFTENTFDDFRQEQELLATMIVQKRFKPLRRRIKELRFINLPAVYGQLFAKTNYFSSFFTRIRRPDHWETICLQTLEKLEEGELFYEDATPYLYLKEKIEGRLTNTSVKHVFVDEAQDYSPFQFAFMKQLFPYSRWTVLGDLNQGIFAHADNDGLDHLFSLYESEKKEMMVLNRSYRSTKQIVEFTRQFISGGNKIEPFNRKGEKPVVTEVVDKRDLHCKIVERIRQLKTSGHETIAVICKTAQESRTAYEAMKEDLSLRLIRKETTSFERDISILPSYLAKGIEFDAVIIYDASYDRYSRENERKLFYTACTRAMHELQLYFIGEKSPFVAAAAPGTYAVEENDVK
ncbi:RNA polymerase recycling motor HelD [Priestia abyssalis]|uniref:RNA polymerase recycling motor HelD n=1 Tax=Priestia abyssalis TaxID=1221450 RepID=UPI0009957416|nr:RNA polymerase recycling motor HelD [Priestia abyssalis]